MVCPNSIKSSLSVISLFRLSSVNSLSYRHILVWFFVDVCGSFHCSSRGLKIRKHLRLYCQMLPTISIHHHNRIWASQLFCVFFPVLFHSLNTYSLFLPFLISVPFIFIKISSILLNIKIRWNKSRIIFPSPTSCILVGELA